MMSIDRTAVAHIPCARCKAIPGSPCRTSGGHPSRAHSVRTRTLYAVWRDGYAYGSSDLASHALGAAGDSEAWARFVKRAERIVAAKGPKS